MSALVKLRRAHHLQARRPGGKFHGLSALVYFAIGLDRAGAGAGKTETGAAAEHDVRRFSQRAIGESEAESCHPEERAGPDRHQVQLAVVDASGRGDEGVVAVLAGVRDRDRGGPECFRAAVMFERIVGGPMAEPAASASAQIPREPAVALLVEASRDFRFEAES